MIFSILKIMFGAVLAAGLLLGSDARQPLDDNNKISITVGQQHHHHHHHHQKKWTVNDLSVMARSHTTKDAVSYLVASVAQGSGMPALNMDEVDKLINSMPAADLRDALLMSTGMKSRRKAKGDTDIANFAKNVDPAATCATEDTAGGQGIDACEAGCEDRSSYLGWNSHSGACLMLCSLAASPCSKVPVSWKIAESAKSWAQSAISWKTLVIAWIAMLSLKRKVAFLVLVRVAHALYAKVESGKMRRRAHEREGKQWRCTRDTDALKGAVLVELHEKLLKRRALCTLHDFAALATYRAAQEAEAAEAAAAEVAAEAEAAAAKAVALKEAIEAVAAEQAAWEDKGGGGGGCVVS